jgi:predicted nuclease of restriction endonuclease-like RecB superfamily
VLTGDLCRARVRRQEISPSFIDVDQAQWTEPATAFCALVAAALEERWTHGELLQRLDEAVGTHRSVKVLRGLVKLLLDRCEFSVETPIPPAELRERVFSHARARGPIALSHDLFGRVTAREVLAEVGEALGLSAQQVEDTLYADLKDAQVLAAYRALTPEQLLARYNVALVQALLLRARRVDLELHAPEVPRLRQLLRFAKFHQLIHLGEREGELVRLSFDGPASLLSQSTRYGMALARFFPAVLLQPGRWQLTAEVEWGVDRQLCRLSLDDAAPLRSHYRDTGAYQTREQEWFVERWQAMGEVGWTLSEETMPIELGGHGVVMPDFRFTDGRREAFLEIVGHWRRGYLEKRVEALRRFGPGNFILAVSKKLGAEAEALEQIGQEVIVFGQIVPPKEVLAAVERVAR